MQINHNNDDKKELEKVKFIIDYYENNKENFKKKDILISSLNQKEIDDNREFIKTHTEFIIQNREWIKKITHTEKEIPKKLEKKRNAIQKIFEKIDNINTERIDKHKQKIHNLKIIITIFFITMLSILNIKKYHPWIIIFLTVLAGYSIKLFFEINELKKKLNNVFH